MRSLVNYIKRLPNLTILPKENITKHSNMENLNLYESSDSLDSSIEDNELCLTDTSNLSYAEFTCHLMELVDMQLVKIRSKK